MHFSTFSTAIVSLALVNANPHMMKRYGNETTSSLSTISYDATTETMPTFATTASTTAGLTEAMSSALLSSSTEVLPTISPANSTYNGNTFGPIITSSEVVQVTTSVDTATLTYTLGPEGASSVVTTTVEETSTISRTVTMYSTVTQYGDLASSAAAEPTTTITSYSTTTKTITLQSVEASSVAQPSSDSGAGSFFQSGNSNAGGSNSGTNSDSISGSNSGPSVDGACGITTVTATIVEKSTVTVTPTLSPSGENVPVALTATPSYGFGNGTDSSTPKYGTASSGFLTLHQPRPTGL